MSNKRGEPTKKDVFDEMLVRSSVGLFRINDEKSYLKLMVDCERMCTAMAEAAAEAEANVEDMFGLWATWSETFAHRDAQRALSPEGVADPYTTVQDSKRDVSAPVDMAHNTTTTLTETINFRNLKNRLLLSNNLKEGEKRRLVRFFQRIEMEGTDVGDDLWSLQVSYYCKPCYDRLYSIGPSPQKQTEEAKRAAAGCCNFRFLLLKLKQLIVYTPDEWPMLTKFNMHHPVCRKFISVYSRVAAEDAKLSLIKIRYGAPAQRDLPMIKKLCAEVHAAATALVDHSTTVRFSSRHPDRPNLTFSRLSATLTEVEAQMLDCLRHHRVSCGLTIVFLEFDGFLVRCVTFKDVVSVQYALEKTPF